MTIRIEVKELKLVSGEVIALYAGHYCPGVGGVFYTIPDSSDWNFCAGCGEQLTEEMKSKIRQVLAWRAPKAGR